MPVEKPAGRHPKMPKLQLLCKSEFFKSQSSPYLGADDARSITWELGGLGVDPRREGTRPGREGLGDALEYIACAGETLPHVESRGGIS